MSKFDLWMKNTLLAFIGLMALSGMLIYSFLESKDIPLSEVFNGEIIEIDWDSGSFFEDLEKLDLTIRTSFSDYATIELYEEASYDVVPTIEIKASTERIRFVHEDREDLLVTFQRDVPDTPLYDLDYTTRATSNRLIIESDLNGSNIHTDQDYLGTITIYVPEDYVCEELIIHAAVATDDLMLPDKVERAKIDISFGKGDLTLEHPMKALDISVNAGDMDLQIDASVGNLTASVDAGEITIDVYDHIGQLVLENNVGAIRADLDISPSVMSVSSDMGDVSLNFEEVIHSLTAELNLGDLDIDAVREDPGVVYISSDLVNVNSSLTTTNDKNMANVFVEMNLGNLSIH